MIYLLKIDEKNLNSFLFSLISELTPEDIKQFISKSHVGAFILDRHQLYYTLTGLKAQIANWRNNIGVIYFLGPDGLLCNRVINIENILKKVNFK